MDEPAASFRGRVGRDGGGRRAAGGLAAIALVVIGAAIAGLGSGPDEAAVVPSSSPTDAPTVATAAPSPLSECRPLDPAGPVPLLHLGSDAKPVGVRGLLGSTHRPGHVSPPSGWQIPPPEMALSTVPGEPLRLVLGTGQCLRAAHVEAAMTAAGTTSRLGDRRTLVDAVLDPPTPTVTIAPLLPAGVAVEDPSGLDWVLRVTVVYWTGPEVGLQRNVWSELYFRVRIVTEPPAPTPTPLVTPNVPCKFFVAEGGVGARLVAGGQEPVYGPPDAAFAPLLEVAPFMPVTILLDGDGCAIEWVVEFLDPATGGVKLTTESIENPTGDPNHAAQNRWQLRQVPIGEWLLHLAYRSTADGPSLEAWWRIRMSGE